MLRYNGSNVRRLKANSDKGRLPFAGSYPTRLYVSALNYEYLGKPTPDAWKQAIKRTAKQDRYPLFFEFDRNGLIRRSVEGNYVKNYRSAASYYCIDRDELAHLTFDVYPTFTPLRLPEGTVYRSSLTQRHYPELSKADWFALARKCIRSDFSPETFARLREARLPQERTVEKEEIPVNKLFVQLLRERNVTASLVRAEPPRLRDEIPLPPQIPTLQTHAQVAANYLRQVQAARMLMPDTVLEQNRPPEQPTINLLRYDPVQTLTNWPAPTEGPANWEFIVEQEGRE